MPPSTPTARDRVLEAARRNPDMTAAQIAGIVGCHPSTVHRHLPKHAGGGARTQGLEPPPAPDIAPLGAHTHDNGPGAPLAEFADIGQDTPRPVGAAAAADPSCPPETLRALSQEPYTWQVHAKIAGHPNCPDDAMEMYQYDEDADVRFALYANPNSDDATRAEIKESWSVDVRQRGAALPPLPARTARRARLGPRREGAQSCSGQPQHPCRATRPARRRPLAGTTEHRLRPLPSLGARSGREVRATAGTAAGRANGAPTR